MQNLTILKVEGLGDLSQTECVIHTNSVIFDKLSLNSVVSCTIPGDPGCVTVMIRDEASGLPIASLRFFLNVIEEPGIMWLPLFLSDENFIQFIPDEVELPRVLLDVHPSIMDPVVDFTESSDCEELFSDQPSKVVPQNVELMIKVTELENSLNLIRINSEIEIEETVQKYKETIQKLLDQLDKTQKLLKNKEDSLNTVLKENEMLRLSIDKLLSERTELTGKVCKLERLYESFYKYSSLTNKDAVAKMRIVPNDSFGVFPNYTAVGKSEEIFNLSSKLAEIEKSMKKFKVFSEVEEKVVALLRTIGLEGFLRMTDEVVYAVGNKRINVFVKKNLVQVRCGGFCKTLEAYIGSSCTSEIQSFMKNRKSKCSSPESCQKRSMQPTEIEKLREAVINRSFEHGTKPNVPKSRSRVLKKVKFFEPLGQTLGSRIM